MEYLTLLIELIRLAVALLTLLLFLLDKASDRRHKL